MRINKQFLESLEPCEDRWDNYLEHYSEFSGSVLDFLKLEKITVDDKFWVVLREEILPSNILHEFACKCAEHVLHFFEKKFPEDKRPRLAIEAKRKWIKGEITDEELTAARAAAWDAARAAVRGAWAAARGAWAAARGAGAAVRVAEKEWQFKILVKMIEDQND